MKVKEESEKAGLKLSIREIKSCHLVPHFKSYWWRYNGIQDSFNFLDFQHHCGQWLKPWMCKTLAPWMKSYDQCGHRLKSRVITDKDPNSQSYGFSRSHLWSWEMDNTRTECQITEALQLSGWRILLTVLWTAEVSNNSVMKEINWDSSRRDWSWMWRAIVWPSEAKSQITGKDPEAGKDLVQEEKGTKEDSSAQFSSVTQSYLTLYDSMDCNTPGLSVLTNSQDLFKCMPTESVMPSNRHILCHLPLLPLWIFPSIRVFSWVSSLHQVAKVLEFQPLHQSFQWIFRTYFL